MSFVCSLVKKTNFWLRWLLQQKSKEVGKKELHMTDRTKRVKMTISFCDREAVRHGWQCQSGFLRTHQNFVKI